MLFEKACDKEDYDGCREVARIAGDVFAGMKKADCTGLGYDLSDRDKTLMTAKTFLKKTYDFTPDDLDNLGGLHSIYLRIGEFEEGEKILKRAYEMTINALGKEKDAYNYGNVAWYALFIPDFATTEKYAKEGLSLDPKQYWINANLGHAYLFQGRKQEAIAEYKKFIDNFPDNPIDMLRDDFFLLKKRYPEKTSLIEWAETEMGLGK